MKKIIVKCPNCGTRSTVSDTASQVNCIFCHAVFDIGNSMMVPDGNDEATKDNFELARDYIREGDRLYSEGRYKEAFSNYKEASIFDIQNPKALWRAGICQSLTDGYENFDNTYMIDGAKKAFTILKAEPGSEEKINFIVNEYFNIIGQYRNFWKNTYNSKTKCEKADVVSYNSSLFYSVKSYEALADIINDENTKNNLYSECLKCYNEIDRKKYYYERRKKLKYILTYKQLNDMEMDRRRLLAKPGVNTKNDNKNENKIENEIGKKFNINLGNKTEFDESYIAIVKKMAKWLIIAIIAVIALVILIKIFELAPKAIKGFPDIVGWFKNIGNNIQNMWNDVRNNLSN